MVQHRAERIHAAIVSSDIGSWANSTVRSTACTVSFSNPPSLPSSSANFSTAVYNALIGKFSLPDLAVKPSTNFSCW
ncbi:hypothetical protein AG1IA_09927 [Rhizoctonia solani AG-1 IA]|uniref:Uncharacterized protein n=1 Tax=Thanatephorus cucumeris (strain AG1-IA) TaxID=983506 RepID=L8WI43_THACA|nr:hypothetical protein AG1IA_09927 [Rhizoctonia solani AG-1 IA]